MANQPHPDKKAVTWRLPRALLAEVNEAARHRGVTVVSLVADALRREVRRTAD